MNHRVVLQANGVIMNAVKKISLALTLFMVSIPIAFSEAQQSEPLYQVEVFIYSRDGHEKLQPESNLKLSKYQSNMAVPLLPSYNELNNFESTKDLNRSRYQHLPSDQLTLNNVKIAMDHKFSIATVLHTAWIQSATSLRDTIPVRIQSDQSYLRSDQLFPENTGEDFYDASQISLQQTAQLFGLIRLIKVRNNYHTIRINLVYARPSRQLMPRSSHEDYQPMLKYFHIDQEQPVELGINRINFFDNPAFGVIANVTRVN